MLPSPIRTAIDLKKAVDAAPCKLQPIGRCLTATDDFRWWHLAGRDEDEDEDMAEPTAAEEIERSNKDLADTLAGFCCSHQPVWGSVYHEDQLPKYNLTITRPGCEFTGTVSDRYEEAYKKAVRDGLLKRWFDNATQAGYGDVRAQETKVDVTVRDAREITCDEFEVDSALLEKIAELWAAHFFPARVRVEPYKIVLYGPGGHFKPHKDTMEKNLVGTFLTGLGQTEFDYADVDDGVEGNDNLVVAGNSYSAEPLRWVAFYPDVVHKVRPVKNGHRAMLAFKIFRLDTDADGETPADRLRAAGHATIEPLVAQLRAPVGFLLQRQYGISTTALSGFDAVLLDCARARAAASGGELEVHLLPVLTHLTGQATITNEWKDIQVTAKVFPLTDAHVDIILGRNAEHAREKIAWLQEVSDVPFFAIENMGSCGETWRQHKSDGAEYAGNHALPAEEDSIYLSFAMMMLAPRKEE